MSLSFTIDLTQRTVLHRAWGTVTDLEAYSHLHALREDPRFAAGLHHLVDVREVTVLGVTPAMVQHVARCPHLGPEGRCAVVTATLEQFGVARMFELHAAAENAAVAVFRRWSDAADWLGLEGDHLRDPRPALGVE